MEVGTEHGTIGHPSQYYNNYHMFGATTTLNAVSSPGVVVTLEIFFLGLVLPVTVINIKNVHKQENKNVRNVKKKKGMPKCKQGRASAS